MSGAPTRLATTILVLRPSDDGFEVFLVRRHRRSGFLPDAWVFPGGRVDASDALADDPAVRGGERAMAHLGLGRDEAVATLVAGVRETFEEAGIWLGDGALPEAARLPLSRGEVRLADLLAQHEATIDLDRLAPWAWWITPEIEPKRYDTRFLVAVAPRGAGGVHDTHETVESGWFTPAEILEGADAGRFPMAPPTWWTLCELVAFQRAEEVFAAGWTRPSAPIQPILHLGPDGLQLCLPGHPSHPAPAIPGLPPIVCFRQGRWWTEETGSRTETP